MKNMGFALLLFLAAATFYMGTCYLVDRITSHNKKHQKKKLIHYVEMTLISAFLGFLVFLGWLGLFSLK